MIFSLKGKFRLGATAFLYLIDNMKDKQNS